MKAGTAARSIPVGNAGEKNGTELNLSREQIIEGIYRVGQAGNGNKTYAMAYGYASAETGAADHAGR